MDGHFYVALWYILEFTAKVSSNPGTNLLCRAHPGVNLNVDAEICVEIHTAYHQSRSTENGG